MEGVSVGACVGATVGMALLPPPFPDMWMFLSAMNSSGVGGVAGRGIRRVV